MPTHLHDTWGQAASATPRTPCHSLQHLSHVLVSLTLTLAWLHHHAHELALVGLDLLQQCGVMAAQLLQYRDSTVQRSTGQYSAVQGSMKE
jgi:hypothetical protein